jgi:hypothetical protein
VDAERAIEIVADVVLARPHELDGRAGLDSFPRGKGLQNSLPDFCQSTAAIVRSAFKFMLTSRRA